MRPSLEPCVCSCRCLSLQISLQHFEKCLFFASLTEQCSALLRFCERPCNLYGTRPGRRPPWRSASSLPWLTHLALWHRSFVIILVDARAGLDRTPRWEHEIILRVERRAHLCPVATCRQNGRETQLSNYRFVSFSLQFCFPAGNCKPCLVRSGINNNGRSVQTDPAHTDGPPTRHRRAC